MSTKIGNEIFLGNNLKLGRRLILTRIRISFRISADCEFLGICSRKSCKGSGEWGCSATSVWYRMVMNVFCRLKILVVKLLVADCAVTTVSLIHDHSFSRTLAAVVVQFADEPHRHVWVGGGDGDPRCLAGTEAGFAGVEKNSTEYGTRTTADRSAAGWVDDFDRWCVFNHSRYHDRSGGVQPFDSCV